MKANVTVILFLVFMFIMAGNVSTAVTVAERDALVALYNSTGGPNLTNNTNWLTFSPVSEWYGVAVSGDHITQLHLGANQLTDSILPETGNLPNLTQFLLQNNQFSGYGSIG